MNNKLVFLPNTTEYHDFVIAFNKTEYYCNVAACGEALEVYTKEYTNALELMFHAEPLTSIALQNEGAPIVEDWATLETALASIHANAKTVAAAPKVSFDIVQLPSNGRSRYKFQHGDDIYYARLGACGEGLYITERDGGYGSSEAITTIPLDHDYRVTEETWNTVKAALDSIKSRPKLN